MIQGKYFSFTTGSVVAGQDLIATTKSLLGATTLVSPRKLTLISSGSLAFNMNNLSADSTLFRDVDALYKLSLDADDVVVKSLVIKQTSACPVFLAVVF